MRNIFFNISSLFISVTPVIPEPCKKYYLYLIHIIEGFPWTDGITSSIKKYFSESEHKVELYFEYLDRKRFSDKAYMKLLPSYIFKEICRDKL